MVIKKTKSFFHKFVSRGFLAFDIGEIEYETELRVIKNGKEIFREHKTFRTTDSRIPSQLKKYIEALQKKYSILYIGTNFLSYRQGTLVNDTQKTLELMYGDIRHITGFYHGDALLYSFEQDVEDVRSMYEDSFNYVDFLFPPQLILKDMAKDMVADEKRLVILIRDSYISYVVLDAKGIYYSNIYIISSLMMNIYASDSFEDTGDETAFDMLGVEDDRDVLDTFDKDEEHEEVMGNIEDELDRFDDVELETFDDKFSDFKDTSEEMVKEQKEQEEKKLKKLSMINSNMDKIISTAENTINSYYGVEGPNVDFISDIVLFDNLGASDSIKMALEDNLFIDVTVDSDFSVLEHIHEYMAKEIS